MSAPWSEWTRWAVLAALCAHGLTQAVRLGDALSGPLWPAETAERLRGLDGPAVAGNHERQAGSFAVSLHATPCDHEAAARQAEAQGRGDWADALRTGRVGRTEREALAAGPQRGASA